MMIAITEAFSGIGQEASAERLILNGFAATGP